nr:NUDIX domain-containing protein [Bacilli bacterium]
MYKGRAGVTRDFVATGIVAIEDRVVLVFHKKLRRWLPPGGHIDAPELPDQAAIREVKEETGLDVRLIADYEPAGFDHALPRPAGIQLEDIEPGHQHIDLIYFATPIGDTTLHISDESESIGWFTIDKMKEMGVTDEVIAWSQKAIQAVRKDHS